MTAILVGIFLVVLSIAGMLFYKHYKKRKDEFADMPELVSAENNGIDEVVSPPGKFRCRFVFQGNQAGKSDQEKAVLDEFHNFKKMGAFKNLTMIHTPDEPCGAYKMGSSKRQPHVADSTTTAELSI